MGERDASRTVFTELSAARVGGALRRGVLYPLTETFRGRIVKLEASYCFIARDGSGDWIYANRESFGDVEWRGIVMGSRVSFKIGFNFRGATAFDTSVIG